jgi:phosphoribosylanthranilate isomerase
VLTPCLLDNARGFSSRGMIVQIYEVTTPAEARALGAMGVDHIGVLVGDGSFPREQTIENACEIFAAIPSASKASALSLSHDVDLIVQLTAALMPDILHLGAAPQRLSPAQLRMLKAEFPRVPLMRSIPVVDESSIALARSYDGVADWLLLDSYKSGDRQIGALGVTHSWELDRRIIESVCIPAIIAGGLGPENIQDAIRVAHPAGVDSKTKTDQSDGSHTKDLQKVSAFVKATRSLNLAPYSDSAP